MENIVVPMNHMIVELRSFTDKVESTRDSSGRFVPQTRVSRPAIIPGSGVPTLSLQVYGIAEYFDSKGEKKMSAMVAWPLGPARSSHGAEELLKALCRMEISIERTAYAREMVILRASGNERPLKPWNGIMKRGAAYPASKVCPASTKIDTTLKVTFRVVHLDVTVLTSPRTHIARMTTRGFKTEAAVAVNLRIVLAVSKAIKDKGIKISTISKPGSLSDSKVLVDFMVHLCLLKHSRQKTYNADYAKKKLDAMAVEVSMGYVGGISIHATVTGRMTKVMRASMGGSRQQMYSLMDVQPALNAALWLEQCEIHEVHGVIQASSVGDFRFFPGVSSKLDKGAIRSHKTM